MSKFEHRDDAVERHGRMVDEPLRAERTFFLAAERDDDDGAGERARRDEPRHLEDRGGPRRVVVGAVVDRASGARIGGEHRAHPEMIVVRAQHDVLPAELRVAPRDHRDDVARLDLRRQPGVCHPGSARRERLLVAPAERTEAECAHAPHEVGSGRVVSGCSRESPLESVGREIRDVGTDRAVGTARRARRDRRASARRVRPPNAERPPSAEEGTGRSRRARGEQRASAQAYGRARGAQRCAAVGCASSS